MIPNLRSPMILLCVLLAASRALAGAQVHHDLRVVLDPERHALEAEDRITVADGVRELNFALHAGLHPVGVEGAEPIHQLIG